MSSTSTVPAGSACDRWPGASASVSCGMPRAPAVLSRIWERMVMADVETQELREIGVGINVVEMENVVEGRILFLDSPQEVLRFVTGDDVASTIVISRGGTTTFMAPALSAGVHGLITLQGAPE